MICVEDEKGDGGEQCASKGYDMHSAYSFLDRRKPHTTV